MSVITTLRKFVRTQTVTIRAETRDGLTNPAVLFDPSSGVALTVKDALGATIHAAVAMVSTGLGTWAYSFTLASDAALGVWRASVKATDAGGVGQSQDYAVFEVVAS